MTWAILVWAVVGSVFAFVLAHKVEALTASEKALRTDRDHWHSRWATLNNEVAALEAVITANRVARSEAGRKAAATRKLRALAEGTDTNTNGATE